MSDATGRRERDRADLIRVIINPKAAGGKGIRLLPRLVGTLNLLGRAHHVHITTRPGEAIDVAHRFALSGSALVIAVGGDGTVNEVANGLLLGGGLSALGVIPAGRGSDFARTLRVSRDVAEAVTAFGQRATRRVDVGRADYEDGTSRFFVNAAGLGFDGAVAEVATATRLPGSTLPYLHGVIGALLRYHNVEVTIDADGRRATGHACSVIVSNTPFVAGGMKLVPSADLADGLLDLAVLGDLSKLALIRNVPKVYRGTHTNDPKFTHALVRRVRIETTAPILVQLDGELAGHPPVTFSVVPGALSVMT